MHVSTNIKRVYAGVLTEEYLREIMTTMGDRWTDEMVDELLHGAPIDVSNELLPY